MTRSALSVLLLAVASLGVVACEGRDIAVFDVPATGGSGGAGGSGSSGGGAGGSAGSVSNLTGDAAGSMTALPAGPDTGGSVAVAAQGGAGGASTDPGAVGGGGITGGVGTPPMPCVSDTDCMGWRCEKQGCDAASGFCEPPPIFCPPDPMPVCGCDGVTYWNDCIRRQSGAQVSAPEECRADACACEVGSDCKVANASCNHLVDMCGRSKGACWVLPPQCLPNGDPHMWQECKPPGAPPGPCVDTCSAILSEKSYAPQRSGVACN